MSVGTRSDPTHHLPVVPDGLIAQRVRIARLDREGRETQSATTFLLGERFVNIDPGTSGQPLLASDSTLGGRGTLSVELTDVLILLPQGEEPGWTAPRPIFGTLRAPGSRPCRR